MFVVIGISVTVESQTPSTKEPPALAGGHIGKELGEPVIENNDIVGDDLTDGGKPEGVVLLEVPLKVPLEFGAKIPTYISQNNSWPQRRSGSLIANLQNQ